MKKSKKLIATIMANLLSLALILGAVPGTGIVAHAADPCEHKSTELVWDQNSPEKITVKCSDENCQTELCVLELCAPEYTNGSFGCEAYLDNAYLFCNLTGIDLDSDDIEYYDASNNLLSGDDVPPCTPGSYIAKLVINDDYTLTLPYTLTECSHDVMGYSYDEESNPRYLSYCCQECGYGASISLCAPEKKNSADNRSPEATLECYDEDTWYDLTGVSLDNVLLKYYQDNTQLEAAPTAAGNYVVKATVAGYDLFCKYSIEEPIPVENCDHGYRVDEQTGEVYDDLIYNYLGKYCYVSCPYCNAEASLTFNAPEKEYEGQDASELATITASEKWEDLTRISVAGLASSITYSKCVYDEETGADWVELENAPTSVGSYEAELSFLNSYLSVKYTISDHQHVYDYSVIGEDILRYGCTVLGCDRFAEIGVLYPDNVKKDPNAHLNVYGDWYALTGIDPDTLQIKYYDSEDNPLTEAPTAGGRYKAKVTVPYGSNKTAVLSVEYPIVADHEITSAFSFYDSYIKAYCTYPDCEDSVTLELYSPDIDVSPAAYVDVDKKAWKEFTGIDVSNIDKSIEYYDASGNKLENPPTAPGRYTAKVSVRYGSNENQTAVLFTEYSIVAEHNHVWDYEVGDNYLTAYCTVENCDKNTCLNLFAPDDEGEYSAYIIEDSDWEEITGIDTAGINDTIKYYDESGKELSGAPTTGGTYTAKVSVSYGSGKTATLSVKYSVQAVIPSSGLTCTSGNCTVSLSSEGALKVSGSGAMADYKIVSDRPWDKYSESIKSIEIGDRITRIGNKAFQNLTEVTTVTIPASVKSIGIDAFYRCVKMKDVYCYPLASNLSWFDNAPEDDCSPDDFNLIEKTVCHVRADQFEAYKNKFATGIARTDVNVSFKGDLSVEEVSPSVHEHAVSYSVDLNNDPATVIATCNGTDCTDPSGKAILTIVAPVLTQEGGTGSAAATLSASSNWAELTGIDVSALSIEYLAVNGDDLDALAAAPAVKGNYIARVTVGSGSDYAQAMVEYTIKEKAASDPSENPNVDPETDPEPKPTPDPEPEPTPDPEPEPTPEPEPKPVKDPEKLLEDEGFEETPVSNTAPADSGWASLAAYAPVNEQAGDNDQSLSVSVKPVDQPVATEQLGLKADTKEDGKQVLNWSSAENPVQVGTDDDGKNLDLSIAVANVKTQSVDIEVSKNDDKEGNEEENKEKTEGNKDIMTLKIPLGNNINGLVIFRNHRNADGTETRTAFERLKNMPSDKGKMRDGTMFINEREAYLFISVNSTFTMVYSEDPAWLISFDSGSGVSQAVLPENEKAEKPADPVKEGYDFLGWYDGNNKWDFETGLTKDVFLTAKWQKKDTTPVTDPEKEPVVAPDRSDSEETVAVIPAVFVYRLFNAKTGEHFLSASAAERDALVSAGWTSEGIAFRASAKSSKPVYRLFNAKTGEHIYTIYASEKEKLSNTGWTAEGIAWYAAEDKARPVYRLYKSGTKNGAHLFTVSTAERDALVAAGWVEEGIAFFVK